MNIARQSTGRGEESEATFQDYEVTIVSHRALLPPHPHHEIHHP